MLSISLDTELRQSDRRSYCCWLFYLDWQTFNIHRSYPFCSVTHLHDHHVRKINRQSCLAVSRHPIAHKCIESIIIFKKPNQSLSERNAMRVDFLPIFSYVQNLYPSLATTKARLSRVKASDIILLQLGFDFNKGKLASCGGEEWE